MQYWISQRKYRGKQQYIVKWKGYDDPTWEPEDFLLNETGVPIVPLLRGEWCNSNFTYVTVNAPIILTAVHTF